MKILKIWGNGTPQRPQQDKKEVEWDDFAPDLSEFFGEPENIRKDESFEIDWGAVRAREDWVDAKASNYAPPQERIAPKAFSQVPQAASMAAAAKTAPALKAQEDFAPTSRAEYYEDEEPRHKRRRKNKKKSVKKTKTKKRKKVQQEDEERPKSHRLRTFVLLVMLVAGLYCTAVFSNIPFIAKWRSIYIETAMSTMNHQWLATAFLPPSVINAVVGGREELESGQLGLESSWGGGSFGEGVETSPWKKLEKKFFKEYPEIDEATFNDYMNANEAESITDDGFLMIDKAGLDDKKTGIETIHGDRVLAVDTENGITIARVEGDGYVGRLAIVKDPSRVGLALASGYGSAGSFATDIAEKRNAVLAINASGFFDPEGKGNGGVAHGIVISNGKKYNDAVGGTYKTIAFDNKDRLNIGQYKSSSDFRDAVEFKPALIIDGEKVVKGSAGWGVQPRSAIGQTKDGEVLMLIIDGRAPGYSIGATVGECADILERYGAVQACNLDGGSSSVMVYNGREISKPSAANKTKGRHIPDSFVVYEK